jgi:hypothetical protein
MSSYYWIAVIVFIVIALGAGATQILSALGDRKIAKDVQSNKERLHADPHDTEDKRRD